MKKINLLMVVVILMFSFSVSSKESDHYVNYSYEVSLPITTAALTVVLASEIYKHNMLPRFCIFCKRVGFDEDVRTALKWNYSEKKTAHNLSNIVLGALPFIGLSELAFFNSDFHAPNSGERNALGSASLVYLETIAISLALNQVIKMAVRRRRPYIRCRDNGCGTGSDDNVSFYSGHTSTAFALAVGAATLNGMKGSKYEGLVWGVNLTLAFTVGYLRIAADKHFFSDVLIGAIAGSLAGFLIPKLLHDKESDDSLNKKKLSPFAPPPKPVMIGFGFPI
jgi:membrane-associated phospholipid phosphatase